MRSASRLTHCSLHNVWREKPSRAKSTEESRTSAGLSQDDNWFASFTHMDEKRVRPVDAAIREAHPLDIHPAKGLLPIDIKSGENADSDQVVVKIYREQLVYRELLARIPPGAKSLKKRHGQLQSS
jgi:hypothetical protein